MNGNRQTSTESTTSLTAQQREVIAALIRGATVTDATVRAGVDRTTYYLWQKMDPRFVAELNRAKQEQAEALRAQLRVLSDLAVATVREMLTGKDVPAGVRLKAALALLMSIGVLEPEALGKTDPHKIEFDQLVEMMH
jgi:hypothetical protein